MLSYWRLLPRCSPGFAKTGPPSTCSIAIALDPSGAGKCTVIGRIFSVVTRIGSLFAGQMLKWSGLELLGEFAGTSGVSAL
jgi:hypothetical protein